MRRILQERREKDRGFCDGKTHTDAETSNGP
jgi:hypothetical protein